MGAHEIAIALAASRRAVRLYPPEHPAHREAVRDLHSAVTESIDVRPLVLNLREGRLYEGSDVITEASAATRALVEAMEVRRIESLTFHMGFAETDGSALSEVLSLRPSPDLQPQAELETRGVSAVTISELEDNLTREAEERDRQREADRSLYRAALAALKGTAATLPTETVVESVELARTVAAFLERVAEDPPAMLALASMTGHGERWRFHAVAVMLYSLVLGQGMGLSDKELLSLGLTALTHDIGAVIAPEDDPSATRLSHPVRGARSLGALIDDECVAMIVAYEHHMGMDGSGWPERQAGHIAHPYSRMVAVADRFDNLVRPAEGSPLTPEQAAERLVREASGGPLDPVVVALFVRLVGVFPVGSMVRLSDHAVGIVREPGIDPMRPPVRLVLAADGCELKPTIDVDLTEDARAIVGVIPESVLRLHASDYL